jgi:hypothetical protein
MIWQAMLLSEGNIMYLVWMTLAISTGVVIAKTVKLYTNL